MITTTLEVVNRTVPAPHNTLCGSGCQKIVATDDLYIVRYMGKIFHKRCFVQWYDKRVQRYTCPDCTEGKHFKCEGSYKSRSNGKTYHKPCLCQHADHGKERHGSF